MVSSKYSVQWYYRCCCGCLMSVCFSNGKILSSKFDDTCSLLPTRSPPEADLAGCALAGPCSSVTKGRKQVRPACFLLFGTMTETAYRPWCRFTTRRPRLAQHLQIVGLATAALGLHTAVLVSTFSFVHIKTLCPSEPNTAQNPIIITIYL